MNPLPQSTATHPTIFQFEKGFEVLTHNGRLYVPIRLTDHPAAHLGGSDCLGSPFERKVFVAASDAITDCPADTAADIRKLALRLGAGL